MLTLLSTAEKACSVHATEPERKIARMNARRVAHGLPPIDLAVRVDWPHEIREDADPSLVLPMVLTNWDPAGIRAGACAMHYGIQREFGGLAIPSTVSGASVFFESKWWIGSHNTDYDIAADGTLHPTPFGRIFVTKPALAAAGGADYDTWNNSYAVNPFISGVSPVGAVPAPRHPVILAKIWAYHLAPGRPYSLESLGGCL